MGIEQIDCPTEIAILMATYNGEKYISEQLESIINQTYKNWTLYICDDGSTDNTVEILSKYVTKYPNIILIESRFHHLGACNNFFNLLSRVNSHYYMFSDQDDIWLPFKIEKTYSKIKQVETQYPQTPILIHSDLKIVNSSAQIIYNSFWKFTKIKPTILQHMSFLPVCNPCTGCTMLINNNVKELIYPIPHDAPMHDLWIAFKVSKYGIISNVRDATILYRQHNNNSIGAKRINFKYFISRTKSLSTTLRSQFKMACFFAKNGNGPVFKYFFYKIVYSIIRIF